MTDTITTDADTVTITRGLPDVDTDTVYVAVPASTTKRGKFALRKIFMMWPKGTKHSLQASIDHLIEHWEG